MTALRSPGDLYDQQVFCSSNSCTMSLNIIIWTLQLDNNIYYLIIFHVKTVTGMARTLARTNRLACIVTRMARTLARMTRIARIVTRMARTVTCMARGLPH